MLTGSLAATLSRVIRKAAIERVRVGRTSSRVPTSTCSPVSGAGFVTFRTLAVCGTKEVA